MNNQQSEQTRRAQILVHVPHQPTRADLITKSKQLMAAIERELQKPVLPHPGTQTKAEGKCGAQP